MRSFLRAGCAAAFVLCAGARAQTLTLQFQNQPNVTSLVKGAKGCSDTIFVTYQASVASNCAPALQVWLSASSCGNTPNSAADGGTSTDKILTLSGGTGLSGQVSFPVSDLPSVAGDCNKITDVTNYVCGSYGVNLGTIGSSCNPVQGSTLSVRFDSQPPSPPGVDLTPFDSKLIVNLTAPGGNTSDTAQYQVRYAVKPSDSSTPSFTEPPAFDATTSRFTIDKLINGTTYLVQARAYDLAGNVSAYGPTLPEEGVPVASDGFWARYQDAGGMEQGGCAVPVASGASFGLRFPLVAMTLVALFALVRRRR